MPLKSKQQSKLFRLVAAGKVKLKGLSSAEAQEALDKTNISVLPYKIEQAKKSALDMLKKKYSKGSK